MTLGQYRPTHSMLKLSADRITGRISETKARKFLKNMRYDLIKDNENDLYLESSGHLYGVLDLISQVIPESKVVFIIRDPRTWVRSALNKPEYILYGTFDFSFFNKYIKASDFSDDPYYNKWHQMTKFEKYCWYYNNLNKIVFNKLEQNNIDNYRIYRFEDLFKSETRAETFFDMLSFITSFGDKSYDFQFKPELLDDKVNSDTKHQQNQKNIIKNWQHWGKKKVKILDRHCHYWMERFNYGNEKEWNKIT